MTKPSDFGELVRIYRQRAKMSQNKLARLAGIHPSHLNRIESGERSHPRRKTIEKLANSLFLSSKEMDELLFLAGYVSQGTKLPAGTYGSPPIGNFDEYDKATDINVKDTPENVARYILDLLSTNNIPEYERRYLAQQIRSFSDWLIADRQKNAAFQMGRLRKKGTAKK